MKRPEIVFAEWLADAVWIGHGKKPLTKAHLEHLGENLLRLRGWESLATIPARPTQRNYKAIRDGILYFRSQAEVRYGKAWADNRLSTLFSPQSLARFREFSEIAKFLRDEALKLGRAENKAQESSIKAAST